MDKIQGFAYVLGDDVNTDDIVPSHTLTMRDSNKMAQYTLEYVDSNFTKEIDKGNIIIAGENFGTGSSREEAVNVFKILGIKAIIASIVNLPQKNLIAWSILRRGLVLRITVISATIRIYFNSAQRIPRPFPI